MVIKFVNVTDFCVTGEAAYGYNVKLVNTDNNRCEYLTQCSSHDRWVSLVTNSHTYPSNSRGPGTSFGAGRNRQIMDSNLCHPEIQRSFLHI